MAAFRLRHRYGERFCRPYAGVQLVAGDEGHLLLSPVPGKPEAIPASLSSRRDGILERPLLSYELVVVDFFDPTPPRRTLQLLPPRYIH